MTNETRCPECGAKEALTLEKAIVTLERAEACVARIGKAERKRRMWKRRAENAEKEVERLREAVRVAYSELWEALRLANQIPLSANRRFFAKMTRIIKGSEGDHGQQ